MPDDSKRILVVGGDPIKPLTGLPVEEMAIVLYPQPFVYDPDPKPRVVRDLLRGIDIDKEYELIKQKKSALPARIRRLVVQRMENEWTMDDVIKNNPDLYGNDEKEADNAE